MGKCGERHALSVVGLVTIRWCPECAVFELSASVTEETRSDVVFITPEWARRQRLADDEWLERNLTRKIRSTAAVTRQLEDDERRGRMRLFEDGPEFI